MVLSLLASAWQLPAAGVEDRLGLPARDAAGTASKDVQVLSLHMAPEPSTEYEQFPDSLPARGRGLRTYGQLMSTKSSGFQISDRLVHVVALAIFALVLRCSSVSEPYFADSFRHVNAIASGSLILQPPGYFLFNLTGFITSRLLHLSVVHALDAINIFFGVTGVVVFYALCRRLFDVQHAFLLSLVYACSPLAWFASDIQCTYASMTFFAPLLLFLIRGKRSFVLGCFAWAVMTGFRPSDGFFVLPWMLYEAIDVTWSKRLKGSAFAAAGFLLWWIPTAQRFGGGILAPFTHSKGQAARVAKGVLAGHPSFYSLVNFVRGCTGMTIAWGILTPLVVIGIFWLWRDRWVRSLTIWMAPGIGFFLLYYVSDATYFSYCVAPGLVVAGFFFAKLGRKRLQTVVYSMAVACSLLFMFGARPIAPRSPSRALVDAYFVSFSTWALRHQYGPTLQELMGDVEQAAVVDGETKSDNTVAYLVLSRMATLP